MNEGSVTRAPAPGPVATGGGVADAPVGGSAVPVAAAPRGKVPDGRPPARPEEHAQGPDAAVAGEAPGEAPVASPLGPSPAAAGGPPPDTPGAGTPRPDPASQDKPPKAAVSGPGEGAEGPDQNAEGPDQNALGPDQNAEGPDQNAEGPSQGAGSPDETGPDESGASPAESPVSPDEGTGPHTRDLAPGLDDVASEETIVLSAITEPPRRRLLRRAGRNRDQSAERDGRDEPAQPSWSSVVATTLRLWAQRRLARLRSQPWLARRRWRPVALLTVVVLAVVAVAVTVLLSHRASPGHKPTRSSGSAHNSSSAARALAATARHKAAVWVSHQVSTDAIVSCDPAMCAALQARGVPASRVLVLRTGQADPLGSDVLMATAAVRNQFGSRLAGVYAPVVLAAFGSGAARIEIRVVAPDGAPDYLAALSVDVKARVTAGAQLAHNPRVHTTAAARAQLSAGLVDARVLATLAALAAQHQLDVIQFGDGPGPGAGAGVPLRSADIAWTPKPGSSHKVTLRSLLGFLQAQRPPYRPSVVKEVTSTAQQIVLRVEYSAPSPLGLLGSRG